MNQIRIDMKMKTGLRTLFNIAGLQIGWFSCVLGAANGYPWLGPLVVLIYLSVHLYMSGYRNSEWRLILFAGLLGTFVDGIKRGTGLLTYESAIPNVKWLAPIWITAMWMLFASTFHHSLSSLKGRYGAAALLGAIFGPLSYIAGSRLGGVTFNQDWLVTILLLSLAWGILMSFLIYFSEWLSSRTQFRE